MTFVRESGMSKPLRIFVLADTLRTAAEQAREALRALQRARRVLPLALPAHEQDAEAAAQPLEMVAAHLDRKS